MRLCGLSWRSDLLDRSMSRDLRGLGCTLEGGGTKGIPFRLDSSEGGGETLNSLMELEALGLKGLQTALHILDLLSLSTTGEQGSSTIL